jgi:hypothetical protein
MRKKCEFVAIIFSSFSILAILSCANPSQPTEQKDYVRFTVNGSEDYYYEAGPSGTPDSPLGGTVNLAGFPVAYKLSSNTWVAASAATFPYETTPVRAFGRLWLSFSQFNTGSFTLGQGEDGVLWFNESTTVFSEKIYLIITRFDAVGGRIEGTFSGTIIDSESVISTISNGQFSVTHVKEVSGS